MKRVITAIVGIPVLVTIIQLAPPLACVGLIVPAMFLALHEYFALVSVTLPFRIAGFLIAGFALMSPVVPEFTGILLPGIMILMTVALFSRLELKQAFSLATLTFFGCAYVGGLMSFLVGLRMWEGGSETGADLLLMLFCMIWAGDSFAYFAGRSFGRHKFAPVVSPKKTWEGAVAGFVFSMIAAVVCKYTFIRQMELQDALILGSLIGIAGQIGDLCESIVKRAVQVKDSGGILPGHGGMLDRIDSLLFGAPAMYYYLYFFRS